MANPEHLAILKQGVKVWNAWREKNPGIHHDLDEADLDGMSLFIPKVPKSDNDAVAINLSEVSLVRADLSNVNLIRANLSKSDLRIALITNSRFGMANLCEANLSGALLARTILMDANLAGADLSGSVCKDTDFTGANLRGANLEGADLENATLVDANLELANLSGCSVYGVSAWNVNLVGARQVGLAINRYDEPTITVDNLEVAQFIHLLLNNEKIRAVIDTIARKVVLILGRFTPERKAVLDAIREELRKRDYLPVLFDFDKPATRDFTETMRTLAHLSRFVIADISDPSSIPLELQAVVPDLAVPVQPLLLSGKREFSMFVDLRKKYHWVLATHQYTGINDLLASLGDKVIAPAEQKAKELEKR